MTLDTIKLFFALALQLAADAMRSMIRKIKTLLADLGMDLDSAGLRC